MKIVIILVSTLLYAALASAESHSTIFLHGGNTLKGELLSIDKNGEALTKLEITNKPTTINADSIESIQFEGTAVDYESSERVNLINGDEIPCVIRSMSQKFVELDTWYAGKFKIPTSQINYVQFNTKPEPPIYSGPSSQNSWSHINKWKFLPNSIHAQGRGDIGNNFDLPINYTFRCKVKWDSRQPRFKIFLSSNADNISDSSNHYMLDFSVSRIEVVRSSETSKRNEIGEIQTRLNNLEKRELDIEVRVNRKVPQLIIYLDGEKAGTFHDMSFSPPNGNAILMSSEMPNSDSLTLTQIQLDSWNGIWATDTDHSNTNNDVLYKVSGDVVSGSLVSMETQAPTRQLIFRAQHGKESIPVNLSDIHGITFKNSSETNDFRNNVALKLQGGGILSASSIQLREDSVFISHPTLGDMQINSAALLEIQNKENK